MIQNIFKRISGSLFVLTLSQGNHTGKIKLWEVLIGISGTILFIFVPAIGRPPLHWEINYISLIDVRTKQEQKVYPMINFVIGGLLMLLQIWNLLRVFSPRIATKLHAKLYQGR